VPSNSSRKASSARCSLLTSGSSGLLKTKSSPSPTLPIRSSSTLRLRAACLLQCLLTRLLSALVRYSLAVYVSRICRCRCHFVTLWQCHFGPLLSCRLCLLLACPQPHPSNSPCSPPPLHLATGSVRVLAELFLSSLDQTMQRSCRRQAFRAPPSSGRWRSQRQTGRVQFSAHRPLFDALGFPIYKA